jgi:hypothetical protein
MMIEATSFAQRRDADILMAISPIDNANHMLLLRRADFRCSLSLRITGWQFHRSNKDCTTCSLNPGVNEMDNVISMRVFKTAADTLSTWKNSILE